MSASNSEEFSESSSQHRFSFQYFDQECDFGIENEKGERVRKKKKPGRKPNPPSIQERRAQNRAAQKAFREREQQRREEKEKQWRMYSEEVKKLRKQLAISQYEAKYLKACVLHLTLAFLVHRGSVPQIWSESRIIPSNSHGEYKKPVFRPYGQEIVNEEYQTPALLDMILEKQHIMDFEKAAQLSVERTPFMKYRKRKVDDVDLPVSTYQPYINEEVITLNKDTQEPKRTFPQAKRRKQNSSPALDVIPSTAITPPFILSGSPSDLPPFSSDTHQLLHDRDSSNSTISSTVKPTAYVNGQQDTADDAFATARNDHMLNSNSQALTVHQKPIIDVCLEPPPFRTTEDLIAMPAVQALHVVRLQLKLGSILGGITPASLLPTALQRVIPHDIRIDYIPGASIRDRLILFQDYYDMDECFQYLTQTIVFTGGDVRNPKNWTVDPSYNLKFWFLSHLVYDYTFSECLPTDQIYDISDSILKAPSENEECSSSSSSTSSDMSNGKSSAGKQKNKKKKRTSSNHTSTASVREATSITENV